MNTSLDPSLAAHGAPPGSMRYFATLFCPAAKREVLTALYIIEAEISASVRGASHEIAHARLAWWRSEIDRLLARNPQHPATRTLVPMLDLTAHELESLHELLAAADMDLAGMTYATWSELAVYCARSGGVIQVLAARWLAAPLPLSDRVCNVAQRYGMGVRQVEMLRDLRRDIVQGRLYVPLEVLAACQLTLKDLRAATPAAGLRNLLADWRHSIESECLQQAVPTSPDAAALLHSRVLAALHGRLLTRLFRGHDDFALERIELGHLEKLWTAWRTARLARHNDAARASQSER